MNKTYQVTAAALSLDESGQKHIDKSLMAASKAGRHENQNNSPVIPDSVFADPESSYTTDYRIPGQARYDRF
jgi:hypothetical protein